MKLAIGLTLTALALCAADNSLGTWKRNIEKSKVNTSTAIPNPYKSQVTVREAADGGVKVTSKGERMDGTPANSTYTIKYDGKPVPVTGIRDFDSISVKQIDADTFTSESKKTGGNYHTTGRTVISKDGKTMTNTQKGTDADGKPIAFTIMYDKQ